MTIRLIDHELASTKAAFLVALSLRTSWGGIGIASQIGASGLLSTLEGFGGV